jgi:hypothetical protein
MEIDFVAHGLNISDRKGFIVYLNLLQTNDVGLVFIDKGLQLMEASTQTIDIKADYFHYSS